MKTVGLKKKALGAFDLVTNLVYLGIVITLFCYGLYAIWDTYSFIEKSKSRRYDVYKPPEHYQSFLQLQKENPDVFGWVSIFGTGIDYPLLQTDNNEKYVNVNVWGKASASGAIFLDYRNQKNFTDFNSIIYGHHMEGNAMFGDIEKFQKEDFFSKHKYGNLYFDGANHGVEFFAYLQTTTRDNVIYAPALTQREQQDKHLERIKDLSMQYRNLLISKKDHIALFSTCKGGSREERQILVGRVTDKVFDNPFDKKKNKFKDALEKGKLLWSVIPLWMWAVFIILICLLSVMFRKNQLGKMIINNAKHDDRKKKPPSSK